MAEPFIQLIQIIHTQDIFIYICTKIKIDKIGKMIKYIYNCGLVTMWLLRDHLKLDKDAHSLIWL